jgi:hypothetical protein
MTCLDADLLSNASTDHRATDMSEFIQGLWYTSGRLKIDRGQSSYQLLRGGAKRVCASVTLSTDVAPTRRGSSRLRLRGPVTALVRLRASGT